MFMHFLAQSGRHFIKLAVFVYIQLYSNHLFIFISLFRSMRAFLWILSGAIILINVIIVANSVADFSSTVGKPSVAFYCFMAVIAVLYIGNDVTYLFVYV